MSETDPLGLQMLALARQVTAAELSIDQHASTLAELNEVTGALKAAAGQVDGRTAEVLGLITTLADRVAKLEAKASAPTPDRLWDWTSMDRVKAETAWNTLRGWVEYILVPWYDRLGENQEARTNRPGGKERKPRLRIPPCWAWHRDVVVELSWLCQDWISLYRLQQGSPAKAGDWHSRYLPGALHRIRNTSTAAKCEVRHELLEGIADAPDEPVGEDGDVERAIARDLAMRPEPKAVPRT